MKNNELDPQAAAMSRALWQQENLNLSTVEFNAKTLGLLLYKLSLANRRDGWASASPYSPPEGLERAKKAVDDAEHAVIGYVSNFVAPTAPDSGQVRADALEEAAKSLDVLVESLGPVKRHEFAVYFKRKGFQEAAAAIRALSASKGCDYA